MEDQFRPNNRVPGLIWPCWCRLLGASKKVFVLTNPVFETTEGALLSLALI